MLNLNFNPFPELITERLRLRQLNAADVYELFRMRSDEGVMRYLDRPRLKSVDEAAEFLERVMAQEERNEAVTWALSLKGEDRMIGNICFWQIQKEHYRAEVGYMMHAAYHGKGIMHEAIGAVRKYGFGAMGLHSVQANVNPENTASIKLLEKNGFVREAYFRENFYYDGKFLDSAIYSVLAPTTQV